MDLPERSLHRKTRKFNIYWLFVLLCNTFFRHAGYQYCGACGGHAYRQVSPVVVKRVFILGPSHRVRLSGCALSSAQKYKTPLYDLHIDMAGKESKVNRSIVLKGKKAHF